MQVLCTLSTALCVASLLLLCVCVWHIYSLSLCSFCLKCAWTVAALIVGAVKSKNKTSSMHLKWRRKLTFLSTKEKHPFQRSPVRLVVLMCVCFFKRAWLFPSLWLFLIVFYSQCSPRREPSCSSSLQQMLSSCCNLSTAETILLGCDFYKGVGVGTRHIFPKFTYSLAEKG